jgi:hypothetical protein
VVFTAWLSADPNGDTDVLLASAAQPSAPAAGVATGAGQQRFADVSDTLVAVTDFSEDPSGYFALDRLSLADIVVVDRATLTKTVRHLAGKQAFPMLGQGGRLAYLDWQEVMPEPKLSAYYLRVGRADLPVTMDLNAKADGTMVTVMTVYVRPAVHAAFLDWVDDTSQSALYRRPLDLTTPAAATLGGAPLVGAAATDAMTVVATSVAGGGVALRGVAR